MEDRRRRRIASENLAKGMLRYLDTTVVNTKNTLHDFIFGD